jgi:putative transcriptional regulator
MGAREVRKLMREGRYITLIGGMLAVWSIFSDVLITRAAQSANPSFSFLVATPDMPDPVFQQSVILMLPRTESPLVAGIIVNKPTTITLEQLFPHASAIKNRTQTAYFGGPVDVTDPCLVLRTAQTPAKATRLFDDVYVSSDTDSITGLLGHAKVAKDMRLFFGRAQWTADQLHDELLEGAWYVVPGKPDLIFSSDPASVWRALVHRAQVHEVNAGPPAAGACASDYRTSGSSTESLSANGAEHAGIPVFFADGAPAGINRDDCWRWPVESALR